MCFPAAQMESFRVGAYGERPARAYLTIRLRRGLAAW